MKKIISLLTICLLAITTYSQSIYEQPLKDIDGNTIDLKQYFGKKILFIIVPASTNDSLINKIDSFQVKYGDRVKLVGILSNEDGYIPANKNNIKQLYTNVNLVLTEGLQTRKNAGANQSQLMQWLTDRNKNYHFNMDAQGAGHKFFVDETGRLFAVMPPRTAMDAPIMERIVNSGLPIQ